MWQLRIAGLWETRTDTFLIFIVKQTNQIIYKENKRYLYPLIYMSKSSLETWKN